MRRFSAAAAAFLFLFLPAGCSGPGTDAPRVPGAGRKPHEGLALPPLRAFTQPAPARHVLENGMVVFLMEDHSLPVVDVSGLVRVGAIHEPPDKAGLAGLCAEVMRTGGTASLGGDALDEKLEAAGAEISVSIGTDQGSFRLGSLASDAGTFLPLLADLLRNPAFPEEKLALAKMRFLGGIARRNDDPDAIRERLFPRILYGAESPYARQEETWTVEAVTRQDLAGFHARFFRPDGIILGVSGDFEPDAMLARIRDAFGSWPAGKDAPPAPPAVRPEPPRTVNLARKPDLNQATVVAGHYGTTRRHDDPDYFALLVMGDILGGGGFGTRLFQNVRTREGLAYGVWSDLGSEYDRPGIFMTVCSTKNESAVRALASMTREIRRMIDEDVTPEEISISRESILNALVFEFDTREKILQRHMRYAYRNWPADFIDRFQKGIAAVTVGDVRRVARKYLRPDSLSVLVIGNPDAFDQPLSTLGTVVEIPLETPPPSR